MECKQFRSLVFDFFDESLSPDDLDQIRRHLDDCAGCTKYYRDERKLKAFISDSPALKALRYRGSVPFAAVIDGLFFAPKRRKSQLWPFPFLKPALIVLLLLAAIAVSYVLWSEKPFPNESDSATGDSKAFEDLSYALSDPIRDWAERRLIITVTDSQGRINEAIVTSISPEKILCLKNEERKK